MKLAKQIYEELKPLDISLFVDEKVIQQKIKEQTLKSNYSNEIKQLNFNIQKLKKLHFWYWVVISFYLICLIWWLTSLFSWIGLLHTFNNSNSTYMYVILFLVPICFFVFSWFCFIAFRYLIINRYLFHLYNTKVWLEINKTCFKNDEHTKATYPVGIQLLFYYDQFKTSKSRYSSYQILHGYDLTYNQSLVPFWFKTRSKKLSINLNN